MRIGIVDDEEAMLEFVSGVLKADEFHCDTFRRGRDLISVLGRETFDLLVLDWNVPDMNGLEILEWAQRHIDPCPPVIMLTSRSDKDDVAMALLAGADDFIVKPESPVVISARVAAVLRRVRARPATDRFDNFGPYVFDRQTESVSLHNEPIALTAKEFALAHMFFSNLHKPLSRRYLMESIWKSVAELTTRTLDMHVSRIRSKLQLRSDNGYRLQTVFNYGYRLESC
ncbi:response regulator transcription factor [Novosphingobium sp. SL115]|uniref:response regulator transcription factor n=1 Tax=Novosphingobium sp. SL115 TaxID=2995150 RepID=UPI0022755558|nr:response regulator transcription factor [Novosphingobium sp. SL115]MCY1672553.1 response regulator transcription factor [Novosphingobium sp. SL115]